MANVEHLPGPPYPPTAAGLGLIPTNKVDTPISAVFLVLYILGAVGNMTVLQLNNRRGHKFVISGAMFGYCMSRIMTMVLRIVWANYQHNVSLAIAANIFTAAGVLLLYVINLIFAQRIIRATHPTWGWSKGFSTAFKVLYAFIAIMLVIVITTVVCERYTLDQNRIRIEGDLVLMAQCYLVVVAVLPLPLMLVNYLLPRRRDWKVEDFGKGHWAVRTVALCVGATLLTLGAVFRLAIGFQDHFHPRPLTNPGWYHSKACFWVFDIVVEITTLYLYLLLRVDLRFWVPNGSSGPGDYSRRPGDGKAGELEEKAEPV